MPAGELPSLESIKRFVVVAEQRHFGRAAAILLVAQPSLSRQVRRLEQQLGARLLDRTPQGTSLTEAGEVFLPRARALLCAAAQAAAATKAAAQPNRVIIGYTPGLIITPAVRQLRRKHQDADVQSLHLDWNEARANRLRPGRGDHPRRPARHQPATRPDHDPAARGAAEPGDLGHQGRRPRPPRRGLPQVSP